jgi:hypothetical protein
MQFVLCQWAELFPWQQNIWAVTVQGAGTFYCVHVTQTASSCVTVTNSFAYATGRYSHEHRIATFAKCSLFKADSLTPQAQHAQVYFDRVKSINQVNMSKNSRGSNFSKRLAMQCSIFK